MRALAVTALLLLASGCFGDADPRAALVPYPHMGDVAVYEASGALLELARWENGAPLVSSAAQVRLTLSAAPDALDAARAVHPVFRVTTELAEAGVFAKRSERYVSPRHEAIVQSFYPLSDDQSVVAFDERGFPWLWGASALFGEELREGAEYPFLLPDALGRGQTLALAWRHNGTEDGFDKLVLSGPGASGALWMERGVAWPARVELTLTGPELAPHVRSDGGYPVSIHARRVSLAPGAEPVPPRDRGAGFGPDTSALRATWTGEAPPDGDITALEYPLAQAIADAKLLDKPLADWLAAHDAPILYRGTYQVEPGPVDGSRAPVWLLQWVDRAEEYYEVEVTRTFAPALLPAPVPAVGVPRVERSAPAQPPADENHGWFDVATLPPDLVPLSEGIRIVREVFGATEVQVFLRSFTDPPGWSYFLDGGFEEGGVGRYTVVYNPSTGLIEEATGPVEPRLGPRS